MSQYCAHCGEQVEFFQVPANHVIAQDHPYRTEYENSGGWWVHASGPAQYLRSCAFGPSLGDLLDAYFKFRDAKATPKEVTEKIV